MSKRVVNSFSAAMALQSAISNVVKADVADVSIADFAETHVFSPSDVAHAEDVLISAGKELQINEVRFTVNIKPAVEEWTKQAEARFNDLVTAEAIGTASDDDIMELERLQHERLRLTGGFDPDVMLEQYKRAKMDREILEVLSKYVRIEETIPNKTFG